MPAAGLLVPTNVQGVQLVMVFVQSVASDFSCRAVWGAAGRASCCCLRRTRPARMNEQHTRCFVVHAVVRARLHAGGVPTEARAVARHDTTAAQGQCVPGRGIGAGKSRSRRSVQAYARLSKPHHTSSGPVLRPAKASMGDG